VTDLDEIQLQIRSKKIEIESRLEKGIYVDNAQNRSFGRVGGTYGLDIPEHIKQATKVETIHIHSSDGGKTFTPQRNKLHKKLINKMFGLAKGNQQQPVATLLVGGPGSGKSYIHDQFFKQKGREAVYVNADDIKVALPEWKEYSNFDAKTASTRVHEESSTISKLASKKAIEEKYHLTIDAVMGNLEKAVKIVQDLKANGYKINIIGVLVDPNKALLSAERRKYDKGRHVPRQVVIRGNAGARNTLKVILRSGGSHNISIFDNNGLNKKHPPKPIIHNNKLISSTLLKQFMNQ
jgi:predicted ABC-type ATPase